MPAAGLVVAFFGAQQHQAVPAPVELGFTWHGIVKGPYLNQSRAIILATCRPARRPSDAAPSISPGNRSRVLAAEQHTALPHAFVAGDERHAAGACEAGVTDRR